MARVELAPGAGDSDLATTLATMIGERLEGHPERSAALDRMGGRVAMVAEDDGAGVTLCFEGGRAIVHDGIVGIPDLTLRGERALLARLSGTRAGGPGLPAASGGAARGLLEALRARRLRVYGLPAGLPLPARLGRLLAMS